MTDTRGLTQFYVQEIDMRVINSETPSFMNRPTQSRYVVKSVMHAAQVLEAFRAEGEVLRLRDVVERTGLQLPIR